MKKILASLIVAILLFAMIPAAESVVLKPKIVISAIQFDAPGKDTKLNVNGEWVKISNIGKAPQKMIGWKLKDKGNKHAYTFGTFTLNPGKSVYVHTGKGTNSAQHLYMNKAWHIWNNKGDIAKLFDSKGNLISQRKS